MKRLLAAALLAAMFTTSAQAEGTSWCEEDSVNGNICVWGAVLGLIVVANLLLDDTDLLPSGDFLSSSGSHGLVHGNKGNTASTHAPAARNSYPNWQADEGCAWGSRDYGTC